MRPRCTIQIGERHLSALIDTGAGQTVINEQCFHSLPRSALQHFRKDDTRPCRSASGHVMKSIGTCTLLCKIGSRPLNIDFCILSDLHEPVILGTDFLNKHAAQLDFYKHTLNVGGEIIKTHPLPGQPKVSLVCPARRTILRPNTATDIQLKVERGKSLQGKMNGTYLLTMLDNAEQLKDHPGISIPNTVIKVPKKGKHKRRCHVTAVNHTDAYLTLTPGLPVATIEEIEEDAISKPQMAQIDAVSPEKVKECVTSVPAPTWQQDKLEALLLEKRGLFAEDDTELGYTNLVEMTIDTGDHPPIRQRPYRTPFLQRPAVEKHLKEMKDAHIIQESTSSWASPIVIVPKKDGSTRFCADYRKLNAITNKNAYPLPNIQDILSSLGKAKVFSKMDAKSGFWQVKMAEKDRPKTAFITHAGLYEFNVMPFGLTSSPPVFQELMNRVMQGVQNKYCMAYMDDIVVFSETVEDHFQHLADVFKRLEKANLKLKLSKCEFFKEKIQFLGHVVSSDGVQPDEEKVRVIRDLQPPTTVKQVRSFLGMVSYYRNFLEKFSEIAYPLIALTRKNARFHWDDACQDAFEKLKQHLIEAPILAHPDITKPYKLYTDASLFAVGAILTQDGTDGKERVIQYVSHKLSKGQQKWSCVEREAYACVYALNKLRHYLLGAQFTIYTDHKPLRCLFTSEMKNTRVQRWAIMLNEYGCDIQYRPGRTMKADFVSRILADEPRDATGDEASEEADSMTPICIVDSQEDHDLPDLPEKDGYEGGPVAPNIADLLKSYTYQGIGEAQRDDPFLKQVIADMKAGLTLKDFVLDDDVLYHVARPVRRDQAPRLQLALPDPLVPMVLGMYHDEQGHMGVDKTYDKIRSRYYWDGAYRDVADYVLSCHTCSQRNLRKQRAPLQELPQAQGPMEFLSIDLCGPYPESEDGNSYILSVIDQFTGWPEAKAIPNKEAETVAAYLLEEIIPRHGCPRLLLSDQGSEFCNAVMAALTKALRIHKVRTSPYHASCNGKVERWHRVMNDVLAKRVNHRQTDWDRYIPSALLAYRSSVNESTRMTPFFLMTGRDCVLPMDTLLRPKYRYMGEEYLPVALQRLHEAFTVVKHNAAEARARYKRYHDLKAKSCNYEVGDAVYYHLPVIQPGTAAKLTTRWHTHYRIVEKLSEVNYRIRHQPTGKTKVVHVEHLRPAHPDEAWDKEYEEPEDLPVPPRRHRDITPALPAVPTRRQPLRACRIATPQVEPGRATETRAVKRKISEQEDEALVPDWLFNPPQERRKRPKMATRTGMKRPRDPSPGSPVEEPDSKVSCPDNSMAAEGQEMEAQDSASEVHEVLPMDNCPGDAPGSSQAARKPNSNLLKKMWEWVQEW